MEAKKFAVGERGNILFVNKFNDFLMVHIRKFYEEKPTKFGIALTVKEWRILMNKSNQLNNLIEQMQEALDQREENAKDHEEFESESFHIGFRGYFALVSEFKGDLMVHIRKFDDKGKPTTTGIALKINEWQDLIAHKEEIKEIIKQEIDQNKEQSSNKRKTDEHSNVKRKLFKVSPM